MMPQLMCLIIERKSSSIRTSSLRETIEDVGFEAALIEDDVKGRSTLIYRLRIKGMICTSCSIESALQGVQGVQKAIVALATEEAEIQYDPQLVSANQLIEVVEDTGFKATLITIGEDRRKINLKIDRTHTEHSMRMVEEYLQALPGIEDVNIDLVLYKSMPRSSEGDRRHIFRGRKPEEI